MRKQRAIQLWLDEEDYETLRAAATLAGLSLSGAARACIRYVMREVACSDLVGALMRGALAEIGLKVVREETIQGGDRHGD